MDTTSGGTFGGGTGKATADFGWTDAGASVALQADGGIVVAGSSHNDFALVRFVGDATDTDRDGIYDMYEELRLCRFGIPSRA